MFKCQLTGEISEPKEKPVRLVVQTRARTYYNKVRTDERRFEEVVSEGTEIVKEITVRQKNAHLINNPQR